MSRRTMRAITILILFGMSAWMFSLGAKGWTFYGLASTTTTGYIIALVALLGLLRVNIWYGGPLDPRRDRPKQHPDNHNQRPPPNTQGGPPTPSD